MIKRPTLTYLGQTINTASPQAQGLVSYWPLNDGGGLTAKELVYGKDGTLTNGPTWGMGKFGRALGFDGVDDSVDISASSVNYLYTNAPFTISVWFFVKSPVVNTNQNLIALKHDGADSSAFLVQYSTNNIYNFLFGSKTSWAHGCISLPAADVWHHLSITYNGNSATTLANFSMYLNGIRESVVATPGAYGTRTNQSVLGFTIGGTLNNRLYGFLSDVRIYNRALSANEVQEIYVNPIGLYKDRNPVYLYPYISGGVTNHELLCDSVTIGYPTAQSAQLFQDHFLPLNSAELGYPTAQSASLTQNHVLSCTSVQSGYPTAQSATIEQNHVLLLSSASTGYPTAQSCTITSSGDTYTLSCAPASTGYPTAQSCALTQNHALSCESVVLGAPVAQSCALTQDHALSCNSASTGHPTASNPLISTSAPGTYTLEEIAAAVWDKDLTGTYATGTAGDYVKKILTWVKNVFAVSG